MRTLFGERNSNPKYLFYNLNKLAEHADHNANKKEDLAPKEYFVAGSSISEAFADLKKADNNAPQQKWRKATTYAASHKARGQKLI